MNEAMVAPFRTHNGIVWDDGVVRCTTREHHANVAGGIHGGLISSMLDAVMGGTVILHLPSHQAAVTSSLTVNYLAAGRIGDTLLASATVRRLGRTLAHVDGSLTRESDGKLLATATGVFAIVRRPTAEPLVRH
ncbi:PaaI family thioesterase [Luteococcus sp. Sow4_B9]|uniref:PaaI family thioesterase n=1 Tax=Luteococcus sp. Sow4_B9 TaxID=3438792 RepID=UPI003F96C2DB